MASAPDPKPLTHNDYTVGWVCALSSELTAATAMLEQIHGDLPKPGDDTNAYTLGSISGHNIVIACLPMGKIGNSSAAAVAVQMIRTFPSIRFGLMVGIGGGIPPNVKLGDVVVSKPTGSYPGVVQYDLGKAEEGGRFERTGSLNNPPMSLLTACTKLQTKHQMSGSRIPEYLDELEQKYPKMASAYLWTDSLKDVRFKASYSHVSESSVANDEGDENEIGSGNVAAPGKEIFAEPNVFLVRSIVQWLLAMWIAWVNSMGSSDWQQRAVQNVSPQMGIATEDDDCPRCDKTMISKITPRIANDVVVHYGLIASGNQVVKDAAVRNRISKSLEGRALCVEMEAAGLMDSFPCMVIRGICDYADSHKNDRWQKHAAAVAAAFARELLSHVQPSDVKAESTVKDTLDQLRCEVQECSDNVGAIRLALDNKEDLEILDWLTPVNYGPQHSDSINRRQPGTGQWLLETTEFRQWVEGQKQTLFCPGIPGSGKTILTSIVVDKLITDFQGNGNIGIAYLYCNFQWKDRQSAGDLLSSVLRQLAQGRPTLPQSLKSLHDRHRVLGTRPSLDELSNALHSVVSEYTKVLVIIDALDECQASGGCRDRVLTEIFALQARCEASLFATSRDIPEITMRFNGSLRVEIRASDDDVRRYIEGHIDRHMPPLRGQIEKVPQLKEEIITGIITAVQGMFLLAQIYLGLLNDKVTPKKIKEALAGFRGQASREDQKGKQLANAYDQTMTRIMEQEQGFRGLARGALEWIICAEKPLSIVTLQHALAVEENTTKLSDDNFPDINLIVSVCGGLVTVNEQTDIIRLVHYTTQEYFEQARGTWFPEAQFNITRACITYLSFSDFSSGDCSSLPQDQVSQQLYGDPFYMYAVSYWGHHARKSSRSDRLVQEFLECPTKVVSASQALRIVRHVQISHHEWTLTSPNALLLAATFGLHEMVALLQHLDLGVRDIMGRELLTIAAEAGQAEFVETLLTTGRVSVDSRDDHGRTALSWAAEKGYESIVTLLLATGQVDVDSKDNDGRTPLSWAAWSDSGATVKLLLATCQVDVESKTRARRTPLSWAAQYGSDAIVRLLLATGQVDADSKDYFGQTPLSHAAEFGREATVGLLLATGQVDVDLKDNNGRTPLSWAARHNHEATARLLLASGQVDADSKDTGHRTPLSWAAESGSKATVQLLLETRAEIESKDAEGRTPLSWASSGQQSSYWSGSVELEATVRLLLVSGAQVDSKDNTGRTPLFYAVEHGHERAVELLLRSEAKVDSKDTSRETPLTLASRNGYEEIIKSLLRNGANVDPEDSSGRTPLSWAVESRSDSSEGIIRLLLESGANIDSKDTYGQTPLFYAVQEGRKTAVKQLLEGGADVDWKNESGSTALSLAAWYGYEACTKLLLESGANVDSKDIYGRTPLIKAAEKGRGASVERLLEYGADVNSKNKSGETALMWAARNGHKATVELLLESRPDVNWKDEDGRTALSWASERGHDLTVRLLLDNRANVNSKDEDSRTALIRASERGNDRTVRLLLERGADVNWEDKDGQTALARAIWWGYEECAKLLGDFGVSQNCEARISGND